MTSDQADADLAAHHMQFLIAEVAHDTAGSLLALLSGPSVFKLD